MSLRFVAALIFASAALPAGAQSYKWVDAKGQVNYSNAPPPHVAGIAELVEERISVMGMDPAVRAWAERKFAAEEADWEARKRASIAQQQYYASYQPRSAPSYSSPSRYYTGYYPISYAPGSNMAGPYLVPNSFFSRPHSASGSRSFSHRSHRSTGR